MRSSRLFAFLTLVLTFPAGAQSVRQALDPLSWDEHWTVLEVLQASGHLDDQTRFTTVRLGEPSKADGWAMAGAATGARTAFAVARTGPKVWEATIDLSAKRLLSWTERSGVQPTWLEEEFYSVGATVKSNPEWQAAMRKRGYADFTFLDCVGIPPGNFDLPEFRGRRVARVTCVDPRRARNTWGRFIEGVVAFVDMNEQKVLRVVDDGAVPLPAAVSEYDLEAVPARKPSTPIIISQPLGPGFQLVGNQVTWGRWSFHVQVDQRVGTVISTVRYHDGDRVRPVLYQGHLSEIFVPYMDPSLPWYANNFLDAGEFTAGGIAKPLAPGRDCPENAVYLDNLVIGDNGRPKPVRGSVCLFERYAGDMAWRHHESSGIESRPRRDLVVRFAAVLGNYDYVFDWVFQPDGAIRIMAGASGIPEVKLVKEATVMAAGSNGNGTNGHTADGPRPDAYGRFVAPNVVAVNHDHYFSFRLDLDVDGMTNSFQQDRLVQELLPKEHPRRSLWVAEPVVARTESEGMLHMSMEEPAFWRVLSANTRNHVGYPTSYQLVPGMNGRTLLTADDYPRRRAGFINHHLWVTPYRADERYAAGDYPTLSAPGEGLPKWTSANRPIAGTDIVLWYTMGFHHMVRAEDWPVMPVAWHSLELRPYDFFDRNPALDLPEKP
jgi:primary-amine oxidase